MKYSEYKLIKDKLNLEKRLKNARTILRDVLDRVESVDSSSELSRDELLNMVVLVKDIVSTYEDDYSFKQGFNVCDDLYLERRFSVESEKYAEELIARIGFDYAKYMNCKTYNENRNCGDKSKFVQYGMTYELYRDIKNDIVFLRNIVSGDKQLELYLENVCFKGMKTEEFCSTLLNKKSKAIATYLKKKLIEKVVEAKELEKRSLGTMVKKQSMSTKMKNIMDKEDEIEALALKESTDTESYYQIMGREWAKYEEEQFDEDEERRQALSFKKKIGKAPLFMDEDGTKTVIETKINDIHSNRDDYEIVDETDPLNEN